MLARFFVKVHHGNVTPWQVFPHEGSREREIARGLHRPSLFEAQLCYSLKHKVFGSNHFSHNFASRHGPHGWHLKT
jgi:hypothetical protein